MTLTSNAIAPPEIDYLSITPTDSDAEVNSLCDSDLEAEMTWGEGPIAPLRTETSLDGENRSRSNGNGSVRVKTPQKSVNSLQKSKRLINIHPIRSVPCLPTPNQLPVGGRKQQRWYNDHHFGNKAASTCLEDLMEHMSINVEWRSNFQKLAEPENKEAQISFRKGRVYVDQYAGQPKARRKDMWSEAEVMFSRIDRRARSLLIKSFNTFASFIEAVEYVVLHFIQWCEVPCEIEVSRAFYKLLVHPMEIAKLSESDVRLCLPLVDSAFHRLIIHSVCQFYGIRSRTEANRKFNTKIMILKYGTRKFTQEDLEKLSLCEFIRETRLPRPRVTLPDNPLEDLTKSSECSDGFCIMDYPTA